MLLAPLSGVYWHFSIIKDREVELVRWCGWDQDAGKPMASVKSGSFCLSVDIFFVWSRILLHFLSHLLSSTTSYAETYLLYFCISRDRTFCGFPLKCVTRGRNSTLCWKGLYLKVAAASLHLYYWQRHSPPLLLSMSVFLSRGISGKASPMLLLFFWILDVVSQWERGTWALIWYLALEAKSLVNFSILFCIIL